MDIDDTPPNNGAKAAIGLVVVLALVGAAAAIYFFVLSGGGRGESDRPDRVLVVGPERFDLEDWLKKQGFDGTQADYAQVSAEGSDIEPGADGVAAVAAYADKYGFGFVAFHPPEMYTFDQPVPEGATMAVLSVGDLADPAALTFGTPVPGIEHKDAAALEVGLMLALFEQPVLAAIKDEKIDSGHLEALASLRSANTPAAHDQLVQGQDKLAKLDLAWKAAWEEAEGGVPITPLGAPFEVADAFPLSNGGLIVARHEASWTTSDGKNGTLGHAYTGGLAYYSPAQLAAAREQPGTLPEHTECELLPTESVETITTSPNLDAVMIVSDFGDGGARSITVLAVDPGAGSCPFKKVGNVHKRRSGGGEASMRPHSDGSIYELTDRLRFLQHGRTKSWNYPVVEPAGQATWVADKLVIYSGRVYDESSMESGLAWMSSTETTRREAFVSASDLLGHSIGEHDFELLHRVDEDTLLVLVEERNPRKASVVKIDFTASFDALPKSVDYRAEELANVRQIRLARKMVGGRSVLRSELPPGSQFAVDVGGTKLAMMDHASHINVFVLAPGDTSEPLKIESKGDALVGVPRLSAKGDYIVYERNVVAADTSVVTTQLRWL